MSGFINAIADVLARVLSVFTDWTGSPIAAIALLTLGVKLVLHPLTRKQLKSMKAMQALTPHIAALREKYKDNPQQMNVEMMNLYRAHNVNPFGGCLPLLLQLPILWGLFTVFNRKGIFGGGTFFGIALETRPVTNANFFSSTFWTELWNVIAQQPSGLIVILLIVLVGVTTYLQQRLSVTDPSQARMFLFMPVLFALFAVAFPVGMSIYWIIYSVLGTLEYLLVAGRPSAPGAPIVRSANRPEIFSQRPKNAKKK